MLTEFLHRLRCHVASCGGPRRIEVCPPALLQGANILPSAWRQSLRAWLESGWNPLPHGATDTLMQQTSRRDLDSPRFRRVRDEFMQALQDVRTPMAEMLQRRIAIARSLRELWHLRPEVFKLVALQFSQAEAQCRLDRLNRHFPTRSPRSGFAPLDL